MVKELTEILLCGALGWTLGITLGEIAIPIVIMATAAWGFYCAEQDIPSLRFGI